MEIATGGMLPNAAKPPMMHGFSRIARRANPL